MSAASGLTVSDYLHTLWTETQTRGQVAAAATVIRRGPNGQEALVAFIATSGLLSSAEMTALDGRLRQRLPFHLIPALIQPCAALPRTTQGEVRPGGQAGESRPLCPLAMQDSCHDCVGQADAHTGPTQGTSQLVSAL